MHIEFNTKAKLGILRFIDIFLVKNFTINSLITMP